MEHLPEHKQKQLREIAGIIVKAVDPEKVILFDSHATGRWVEHRDGDEIKLRKLFMELIGSGYALTSLEKIENSNSWTLYVTKKDVLSPEKLHRRNLAFNQLAEYFGVELYDGWDVEKL